MCMGIPMQVERVLSGSAHCRRRGRVDEVDTRLVGDITPGQWLLVSAGVAYERIDEQQATEIDDALQSLDDKLRVHFDP